MRMSREVVTPMLVAAGAIGLPLLIGISRCSSQNNSTDAPAAEVSENQSYDNNSFLPGVGYYHAPYHAWFPMAYNQFDAGRGYYRGGSWFPNTEENINPSARQTSGFAGQSTIPRSTPSSAAVVQANNASRAFRASHSSSSGSRSIFRGGFGSSSHHSFS